MDRMHEHQRRRSLRARVRATFSLLIVLGMLGMGPAAAASPGPVAGLLDLQGQPIDPFADGSRTSVFIFTRTDCPIANRYAPELKRLHQRFAAKQVSFWLVYIDAEETPSAISAHLDEYDHPFFALRDPRHQLVARVGARVTPEAAVFSASGQLVYRGRIDDLYAALGQKRSAPTRHDLESALEAVLQGQPVDEPVTPAVGCTIPLLP